MITEHPASKLVEGYSWPECPRWHDGEFYFADVYAGRILKVTSAGEAVEVLDFSKRDALDGKRVIGGGFGFLPDGRLIVNSFLEQVTLVWDGVSIEVYADLRELAVGPINDMVIDADGRVYVTQLGFNLWEGEEARLSHILCIEPDGSARELTELGLMAGANGITISADGCTVVTAEVQRKRLTAFDRDPQTGALSGTRLFAQLDLLPDGICFDEEGAVWAGQPGGAGAIRVLDGGEITDKVTVDPVLAGRSTACGLGGPDRRTLYLCCGFEARDFDKSVREGQGSVWATEVPFGGGSARP